MDIDERLKREQVANAGRGLLQAIRDNDPGLVAVWLAHGADANRRDERGCTPLFLAAWATKYQAIAELLLERGADVRARTVDGLTPLHVAAVVGDEARIRLFLDRGAEIDARDAAGWTPLHCAAMHGRLEEATLLVSRGADVRHRDHEGRTPQDLLRATMRLDPQHESRWAPLERLLGDVATMKLTVAGPPRGIAEWGLVEALRDNDPSGVAAWLAHGARVDCRDEQGRTPLFRAASATKDQAIAKLLLDRGAKVGGRNVSGLTPLHIAAAVGDQARIGLFLDHGAEIDARDIAGWTPLHCAAALGRLEATTSLVSRGADVSIRDHENRTPQDLLRATMGLDPQHESRWAVLERLLGDATMKLTATGPQRGVPEWRLVEALRDNDPNGVIASLVSRADANLRGEGGRTPLFEAALPWKEPAIAEHLLARGDDVQARDEHQRTPLHVAALYGGEARIDLFLNHGAEIDARDAAGWTPLHCAASLCRLDEATLLVSRGADLSLRDCEDRTPLDLVRDIDLLRGDYRESFERLLAGFLTVRIIETRPESIVFQVEGFHVRYTTAEREETERGMRIIPAGELPEVLQVGKTYERDRDLSSALDEAWREERRRELDLEPER